MVTPIMAFTLQNLPGVMRKQGWVVGAQLMERWFARGAREMPLDEKRGLIPSPDIETRLVTMRWALRFERASAAQQELLTSWSEGPHLRASAGVVQRRFREWRRRHPPGKAPERFGDLSAPTATVDATCQANFKAVSSSMLGPVDDFYAALGAAQINLAVSGMVEQIAPGRSRLMIDEVGTYLRDTYDFIGDQRLGSWGPSGMYRLAFGAPDIPVVAEGAQDDPGHYCWSVSNGSFGDWRRHYRRGGDFVILTDVVRAKLAKPVAMEFAA